MAGILQQGWEVKPNPQSIPDARYPPALVAFVLTTLNMLNGRQRRPQGLVRLVSAARLDLHFSVGYRAHSVAGEHAVREAEVDRAGRVEAGQLGGREVDVQGAQVVL